MSHGFLVTLNRQVIFEYNLTRAPARVRRYLDEMDHDMQQGIKLGDEWIEAPTDFQMQQYVAMTLLNGLDRNDSNLVNVMASYLVDRMPELEEIRVEESGELFNLKLITL